MLPSLSLLALGLASTARAQSPGTIVEAGDTMVSAMMMFVGNSDKVYILDKAEGNAVQVQGHPAWASVWDIATNQAEVMEIVSNVFCASGMHLPNGSYATFGGNGAVTVGGNIGSQAGTGGAAEWDATYQDYDGRRAIRLLSPCNGTNDQIVANSECGWWEDANVLQMQKARWYSTAEPLGDGTIVLIGGYVNGGYVNRNYPNIDPAYEGGAAEPTFEFYPSKGDAQVMQFMIQTSGLNSYAHAFLMPSGQMFVQANYSTIMWDPLNNVETPLPDMPNRIVRVYPASGGAAMLPLTPANNWNPTVIFCGGSDMPEQAYGNYSWPFINTWEYPASADCQRITPEPADGSAPTWEQDDDMLETRTMGQFVALPDGTMLMVNGGVNGTAGYSDRTLITPPGQMPYGMSLASGPVGRPSIYNPDAAAGSRWSSAGLSTSNIARLYHSTAILLPDGSVMIAGSNPNVDVNTTTVFPTTYTAEIFYPPYWTANRPVPSGIPSTLSYGGDYFDVTIPSSSYSGSANDAADNTKIMVIRPGWTTHGMTMGQRSLQLNHTYTVNNDGSIVYHVDQMPPNANIFQPGPAFVFVTINGTPSTGTYVIVGSGVVEDQTLGPVSALPASVKVDSVTGSGDAPGSASSSGNGASSISGGAIGGIVGAIALLGLLGAILGVFIARRRRAAAAERRPSGGLDRSPSAGGAGSGAFFEKRDSDSSSFVPLQPTSATTHWDTASRTNLVSPSPYADGGRGVSSGEYDPYHEHPPRMSTSAGPLRY